MYHCFFEQSGTFKNEFKKLGYEAKDYDILNEFGETDVVIDLFDEIKKAYDNAPSLFDIIIGGERTPLLLFSHALDLKHRLRWLSKEHNGNVEVGTMNKNLSMI